MEKNNINTIVVDLVIVYLKKDQLLNIYKKLKTIIQDISMIYVTKFG